MSLTLQKNKPIDASMIYTLKSSTEVVEMWSKPADSTCDISEWYLSSAADTTTLASTHSNYIRFQRSGASLIDDLKVCVEYLQWASIDSAVRIQIWVGTGEYRVLYQKSIEL